MMRSLRSILLAALLLFSLVVPAQNTKPRLSKEPAWITRHTIDYKNAVLDHEAEDGYTDLGFEKQVHLASQTTYIRKSIKVLSQAGVQNASEISISFDPSYRQLILHAVKIIRGDQVLDRTDLSKVKTFQQETELSEHLYNGTYTALLMLEDVRKDDVIEYSYSLRGFNPVFGDKYTDVYSVQYSVPVCHLFYKLVAPAGRSFTIKNNRTTLAPTVEETATEKVYQWQLSNVAALKAEERAPSWFDPFPTILVSEYKSWKEVSDWAIRLYPFDINLSAPLRQKIEEIEKQHTTAEERAGAALRFVQDDVRYMGVELGENSHRPNSPNKVFQQRFGDCKDKAYLLCTMLRRMGMEASPVFINTTDKQSIAGWLPDPTAFDHVTVQVRVNGATYWLDATSSYQRGPLNSISFPNYGIGLVVSPQTTALTKIPLQDKGLIHVKEVFTVTDMSGLARLEVITDYSGSFADSERYRFHNNSKQKVQKDYQDFFSSYFEKIRSDSLSYGDNEQTGVFTTREYYTLSGFWELENLKRRADLSPFIVNGAFREVDNAGRTAPFSLPYPARYKEEIEVRLPEKWNVQPYKQDLKEPSFAFHSRFTGKGNRVSLIFEFETLKDHVAPEEVKDYVKAYKDFTANSGFELTSTDGTDSSPTFASGWLDSDDNFTMLYVLLGLCVAITALVRRTRG